MGEPYVDPNSLKWRILFIVIGFIIIIIGLSLKNMAITFVLFIFGFNFIIGAAAPWLRLYRRRK